MHGRLRLLARLVAAALAVLAVRPELVVGESPADGKTISQTTEVQGTVPDLRGRWLILVRLGTSADQPAVITPRFWDVALEGGHPRVEERFVALPTAVAARQKEAGVHWTPSPADLEEIARSWNELPAEDRGVVAVKTELVERARYDEVLTAEQALGGSEWAVRQTCEFRPGEGRPAREVSLLGIEASTATGFRGKAAYVMVAMAPFPIHVALRGTVDLYRLDAPKPGLLQRILGLFAGCGRTRN